MAEGQEIKRRWTIYVCPNCGRRYGERHLCTECEEPIQVDRGASTPQWHRCESIEVIAVSDHQAALERAEAEAEETATALQGESDDNFREAAEELQATLAKCYRATGSEPSGVDSIDAAHALQAVEETRKEAEESWDQEHARAQAVEAERDRAIEYAEATREDFEHLQDIQGKAQAAEQALEEVLVAIRSHWREKYAGRDFHSTPILPEDRALYDVSSRLRAALAHGEQDR